MEIRRSLSISFTRTGQNNHIQYISPKSCIYGPFLCKAELSGFELINLGQDYHFVINISIYVIFSPYKWIYIQHGHLSVRLY